MQHPMPLKSGIGPNLTNVDCGAWCPVRALSCIAPSDMSSRSYPRLLPPVDVALADGSPSGMLWRGDTGLHPQDDTGIGSPHTHHCQTHSHARHLYRIGGVVSGDDGDDK